MLIGWMRKILLLLNEMRCAMKTPGELSLRPSYLILHLFKRGGSGIPSIFSMLTKSIEGVSVFDWQFVAVFFVLSKETRSMLLALRWRPSSVIVLMNSVDENLFILSVIACFSSNSTLESTELVISHMEYMALIEVLIRS